MTHDGGLPRARAVVDTEGASRGWSVWWRWWPLVAIAGVVSAWFGFGVDVLYGTIVAGVAVYAFAEALERGRSGRRAVLESVAWSVGAWLAGIAFGALTGWGTADRVIQGIWGIIVGATIVAIALAIRTTRQPHGDGSVATGSVPEE